jgi:hypothetical protein
MQKYFLKPSKIFGLKIRLLSWPWGRLPSTIGLVGLLTSCSVPLHDVSALSGTSTTGTALYEANARNCSPYGNGYLGCRSYNARHQIDLAITALQNSPMVPRENRITYSFQCASANTIRAVIQIESYGEIEISSSGAPTVRNVRFNSYKNVRDIGLLVPAHSSGISGQCKVVLLNAVAIPEIRYLQSRWEILRSHRDRAVAARNELSQSESIPRIRSTLSALKEGLRRERATLESSLALEEQLPESEMNDERIEDLHIEIDILNAKIGDVGCAGGRQVCGLTEAIENLATCESSCGSAIGSALQSNNQVIAALDGEIKDLRRFLIGEEARLQRVDQSLSVQIHNILAQ